MRRLAAAIAVAMLCTALAGCSSTHHATSASCVVPAGAGTMGACVPSSRVGLGAPTLARGRLIPDVSEFQACPLHSEAIIRLYEAGTQREDSLARCHAAELHRLHAWAGGYAFLRASTNCTATADRTVQIANELGGIQVIIGDAETGIREGKVRCFLREVERRGYPAIEYTCPGCGDEQVGHIWIASYPTRPAGRWVAHQFTDRTSCRGVFGDCSIDEGILAIRRAVPKPPPPRSKQLAHWEHEILVIRHELAVHQCRVVHGKRAYRACPRLAREGKAAHRVVNQLRAEGVR